MCTAVTSEEKNTAYQLHIAKTIQNIGLIPARCTYAKMEASLQEIEHSSGILFDAQLTDPRRNPEY